MLNIHLKILNISVNGKAFIRELWFFITYLSVASPKTDRSKKSTFSDRLFMSFFWKPILKLVISQIQSKCWCSNRSFFKCDLFPEMSNWPHSFSWFPELRLPNWNGNNSRPVHNQFYLFLFMPEKKRSPNISNFFQQRSGYISDFTLISHERGFNSTNLLSF